MAYTVNNFVDGTVLYAESLNKMDTKISSLDTNVTNLINAISSFDDIIAVNKTTLESLIRQAALTNLLNNSDFTHTINQRGVTSTTASAYCLGRWIAYISSISLTTSDSDLTMSSSETGNVFIYQKIAITNQLLGKTVTGAAEFSADL